MARYVDVVADYLLGHDRDAVQPPVQQPADLVSDIEKARHDWLVARSYFESVTDPRLVDYAIYSIGAAEKRYMFLLDEARRRGMQVDPLRHEELAGGRLGGNS